MTDPNKHLLDESRFVIFLSFVRMMILQGIRRLTVFALSPQFPDTIFTNQ